MIIENLTKENFWNDIEKRYPLAMNRFKAWLSNYANDNNWGNLFNEAIFTIKKNYTETRAFEDLPFAMQVGIFNQYCGEGLITKADYREMQVAIMTGFIIKHQVDAEING